MDNTTTTTTTQLIIMNNLPIISKIEIKIIKLNSNV